MWHVAQVWHAAGIESHSWPCAWFNACTLTCAVKVMQGKLSCSVGFITDISCFF